jgi:ornithine cyclodeaminase/alanine dehydrogenase-like protein (mu-crystallin family)
VLAWDIDPEKAGGFAREMQEALGLDVTAVQNVRDATEPSGIIVTATSARTPFLTTACVSAGTFVAAVGADSPQKND